MNELKIREPKTKKDQKFWIMLIVFLIMLGSNVEGFLHPMINYMIDTNKINTFISKKMDSNSVWSFKDLILQLKKSNLSYLVNTNDTRDTLISGFIKLEYGQKYGLRAVFNPFEYFINWSSYFTTLSNIFITTIFGFLIFKPNLIGKNKFLSFEVITCGTVLITVTCLIFNFAILPMGFLTVHKWPMTFYQTISNMLLHLFNPVAYVIFVIFFIQHNINIEDKKLINKKLLILSVSILLIYGGYIIVRGGIAVLGGASVNDEKSFPYFFTYVYSSNPIGDSLKFPGFGFIIFLIFVFIILLIVIGFGRMYVAILCYRIKKQNKIKKEKINDSENVIK